MKVKTTFSFPVLLTLIFVILKLGQFGLVATWSWWWVFSPLWISAILLIGIVLGIVLVAVAEIQKEERKKNEVNKRRSQIRKL